MEDEKKRLGIEEARPTRESIIEKLKRFFRSRPSIESLKEKGIYKSWFLLHISFIIPINLGTSSGYGSGFGLGSFAVLWESISCNF